VHVKSRYVYHSLSAVLPHDFVGNNHMFNRCSIYGYVLVSVIYQGFLDNK